MHDIAQIAWENAVVIDPEDAETAARMKAAAGSFAASTWRLRTDPGVSARTLPILAAGILGISSPVAVRKAAERETVATRLAAVTAYSRETWLRVLARMDERLPDPEGFLSALLDAMAKTGADPLLLAIDLLGTGDDGDEGIIGAYRE
jgi:hypothetical protein